MCIVAVILGRLLGMCPNLRHFCYQTLYFTYEHEIFGLDNIGGREVVVRHVFNLKEYLDVVKVWNTPRWNFCT